jgi:3-oxoacyl-[acyl-carrier protein] reductase
MDLGISGRVAMVAAATKGLGRACAEALKQAGCRVSICARTVEGVGWADLAMPADVSVAADLARWHAATVETLGEVDILITNTGGPPVARFLALEEDAWRAGIESTLLNVVRLCKLALPAMVRRRWGRIIHLTSLVAKQPEDELTISSTLRAGLSGLTKTLANQHGPDGITVNAILMGHVMSDRQEHLAEIRSKARGITREAYFADLAETIPLRRVGEPREVGEVAAFLASERASYVTGVSLPVDGGLIRATM